MVSRRTLVLASLAASSAALIIVACVGEDPALIIVPTPEAGTSDDTGAGGDGASPTPKDAGEDANCEGCVTIAATPVLKVARMTLANGTIHYSLADQSIWTVPADGSAAATKLADYTGPNLGGLAAENATLYFSGKKTIDSRWGIFSIPVGGGSVVEIEGTRDGGTTAAAENIAAAQGRVFWSTGTNGSLKMAMTTGPSTDIAGNVGGIQAVSAVNTDVYWGYEKGAVEGIGHCQPPACTNDVQSFVVAPAQPRHLGVSGVYLTWASAADKKLWHAQRDGGVLDGGSKIENFASGTADIVALAVDEAYVYYGVDATSIIFRASHTGEVAPYITGLTGRPIRILVDGSFVYWADSTGIRRRAK